MFGVLAFYAASSTALTLGSLVAHRRAGWPSGYALSYDLMMSWAWPVGLPAFLWRRYRDTRQGS